MTTLRVFDLNGWTSLTEDAAPLASYVAQSRQVRIALAGSGGRSVVVLMDPADAAAFCNEVMAAIHEFKVASRPRQAPGKLLRRQANKPVPRY